jgi:MarR family transcriptional regulator, lower aerobic nicotinate degradation pathway regulator
VTDREAMSLDEGVAMLLQKFKLEPSIIAGSPYATLHANDVGLLVMLRQPEKWSVRRIAQTLGAPITTVSSALDRLESRGLVTRGQVAEDRRMVRIELSAAGHRLVTKIRSNQVEVCRSMLALLDPPDRESLIRLVSRLAQA